MHIKHEIKLDFLLSHPLKIGFHKCDFNSWSLERSPKFSGGKILQDCGQPNIDPEM